MSTDSHPEQAVARRVTGVLEFIVKLVAVGFPILYALGRAYSESYWRELHLQGIMSYTADDYLYFGFVSIVQGVGHLLGIGIYPAIAQGALVGLGVGLITAIVVWVDRLLTRYLRVRATVFRRKIRAVAASKREPEVRALQAGAVVSSGVTFLLVALLAFSIVLLLPLLFAINAGKNQANLERSRLQDPAPKHQVLRPLAYFHQAGVIATAPLLECSDAWCVVFRGSEFVAIPKGDIYQIGYMPQPRAPNL